MNMVSMAITIIKLMINNDDNNYICCSAVGDAVTVYIDGLTEACVLCLEQRCVGDEMFMFELRVP